MNTIIFKDKKEKDVDEQLCSDIISFGNNATLSIEKCQELEKVLKPLCFHLSGTTIELYYHPTPNMPIMIGTVSLDTAKTLHFATCHWIEIESHSRQALESLDLI